MYTLQTVLISYLRVFTIIHFAFTSINESDYIYSLIILLSGNNATSRSKSSFTAKDNKPKGMSREVFGLLGKDGLNPAVVPAPPLTSQFKKKWNAATKGKWIWTKIVPFSARK